MSGWPSQSQFPLDARTVLIEEALDQYRRENKKSRAKKHYTQEWRQGPSGTQPFFVCTFCRALIVRFQDRMSKQAAHAIAKHAHECPVVEQLARRAAEVPGVERSAERQVTIDRLLSTPVPLAVCANCHRHPCGCDL